MRVIGWVTAGCGLVLVVTGLWLAWAYEPGLAVVPTLHRLSAFGLVGGVLAVLVWALPSEALPQRWVGGVLVCISLIFGVTSGLGLAWDQLAVWAADGFDGSGLRGVRALVDDDVRFFLKGVREVSKAEMQRQFFVHVAAIPLTVGGATWVALRRRKGAGAGVSATM